MILSHIYGSSRLKIVNKYVPVVLWVMLVVVADVSARQLTAEKNDATTTNKVGNKSKNIRFILGFCFF